MALTDKLNKVLWRTRSIAGKLGFRPYVVRIVKETRPVTDLFDGVAAPVLTEVLTITSKDGYAPDVQQLKESAYLLGASSKATHRIGPITPEFESGGFTISDIQPTNEPGQIVYWEIEGKGMASGGSRFIAISYNATSPLSIYVDLQKADDGKLL